MTPKKGTWDWKHIALIAIGVPFVLYFLWTTSRFVIAYQSIKHAHVFPTAVVSNGWNNDQNALEQDLPAKAPFTSFTSNNSAYIALTGSTSSAPQRFESHFPDTSTTTQSVASTTPPSVDNATSTDTPSAAPAVPSPIVVPISAPDTGAVLESAPEFPPLLRDDWQSSASGTESFLIPKTASTTENNATSAQSLPLPFMVEPIQQASSTQHASSSSARTPSNSISALQDVGDTIFDFLIPTAYATTTSTVGSVFTEETTTQTFITTPETLHQSNDQDISSCRVLGIECHTMEFFGFNISEALSTKEFHGAQISFSLGAKARESVASDGKFVVRYFHDEAWHTAGDIFVNKEFSNESNGGYFAVELPDVKDWSDFSDIEVEVEFVRGDESIPVTMYLDSLWIDVAFKDRVQDILTGNTDNVTVSNSDNVSLSLREDHSNDNTLVFDDGRSLAFSYTDDLTDTLFIRADKVSYKTGRIPDTEYISVTNTGTQTDSFVLQAVFPGGKGTVSDFAQYLRNIATTTKTTTYADVVYFCDAGWQSVGTTSTCIATNESHACSSVSETAQNCLVENDSVAEGESVTYVNGWVAMPIENLKEGGRVADVAVPDTYLIGAYSTKSFEILPGQTLYFKMSINQPGNGPAKFVLLVRGANVGDLNTEALQSEAWLISQKPIQKNTRKDNGITRISSTSEFNGDELPRFKFSFKSKRSGVSRTVDRLLGRKNEFSVDHVRLNREDGVEEDVPVGVDYGQNGEWTMQIKNQPRSFRPGKYKATVTMKDGANVFDEVVEFYWGVLVLNMDKSSYAPNEKALLMMGALDDIGNNICDANLRLTVTSPDGHSSDVPVEPSAECKRNNVVETADYSAVYQTALGGIYKTELAQFDRNGNALHRITDTFKVEEKTPFVIRRTGATRIYPVADYRMTIDVTAASDFEGEFIESVPADFLLPDLGGADTRMYGGAKNLVWPLSLKAGETKRFSYVYDAPDISPYVYVLGPSAAASNDGTSFSEGREWKLASDATGNMLLYWDQTYIPTGWTCVSCLPTDPFYQRFVMGSSTAGLNGGFSTHTHTATINVNTATSSQGVDTNNQATPTTGHTHAGGTPTISSASNLPAYRQLVLIQYNSTGEPPQIPTGAIAMFDVASSSLPSGWYRYAAQDGKYAYLASTSTVGATGGSNTHTHTINGTSGNAAVTVNIRNPGTSVTVAAANHNHTYSTTTAALSSEPSYVEVLLAKIAATSSPSNSMIAMWSGSPTTGWNVISSSSQAFDARFIKASTTYGTLGGAATGTIPNMIGTFSSGPSGTIARDSTPVNANVATAFHSHLVDVVNASAADIEPPYRSAIIARRDGMPTPQPLIYIPPTPFDNEKSGTSTPYFEFTTTDSVSNGDLVYEFQFDDDSDLDTSPLTDRLSSNETGCSPNCFENRTTPIDTSPFFEGERIRFTLQNASITLNSGTTYFWRARAREATAATWGQWSTTTSYTFVTGVSPSQWFQTADGQFDSDTLSGLETFGDDSVRTVVNPPSGVLVAYGEGAVQTPRYRLWDGSVWSAEASAQNVGGTILWLATAAGTTRDEYILGTQDDQNDINFQVYDGVAGTWGNLQEVTTNIASTTERGFDVAYETLSGRAIAVYCDGDADPSYYIWNGTSWTSGGTIDVSSSINCGWIKLASNPTSNEIILVERNSDIGANSYEAQVWNGSTWGSPKILGRMNEANHEGIAVQYEESGNQAVVVVSNNTTSGFTWTAWDGSSWTAAATQALGDDFEWGTLRADVGSDALTLCYMDEDNDIGTLNWTGSAWSTFVAATNERDTGGNLKDGRAVDCVYETTSGRNHYIMLPYSDTTNGRYQYFNTTSWVAEASVQTIQDSWQVGVVRGGDGTVHAFYWDDVNTEYEVADWNGSAWANALSGTTTIETSSSVTATPYRQPIDMVAQVYEANSGTIISTTIDFTSVSSQTWGDVTWKTTEPSGTSANVQVMYYSGGSCSTLIPDGDLPGNSTGYGVGSVPLNISGLSTSTYNRICLKATLSTGNSNKPSLDEWGVSWQRNATLIQEHFRWYTNTDSTSPSDLWPSGISDIGEDIAIPTSVAPKPGDVLRLRMSILASSTALTAGSKAFKLQYAEGSSCTASMSWQDVGAIGSTTAAWRGYNNATPSDGTTLSSVLISSADTVETYEEENDSVSNPNAIAVGDEGEWDWVLENNATEDRSYCFRMISQGGEVLNQYDQYPALITNSAPAAPALSAPFDFEALASTTPWFVFAADDAQSEELTYQIQVDDSSTFSSVNIDETSDSITYADDFVNVSTPSDKDPFNAAQTIRVIPTSGVPLSNNTTYYWRVRAIDSNGSGEWGSWSDTYSFTVDTSLTVSAWRQTTLFQFAEDDNDLTEATSTNDVVLTPPNTVGTTTGPSISFSQKSIGNVWGSLSWHQSTTSSSILYHVEYYDGTDWGLIPDADLTGNAAGFVNSYVSLLGISPTTYDTIRVQAVLTNSGGAPRLQDWTVSWGTGVNEPTPILLFDNEKTATTTPTFTFTTTDPQGDDLEYEFSIGTLPDYVSSTTKNSVNNSGQFSDVTLPTDTHPFTQGNTVSFTVISPNALTDGNTYWWRVRARDPSGGDAWSPWSESRSFTVDTSVAVSTWFQTTSEQYDTDTLSDTESNSGTARITSLIREAFIVYAESTVQVPRFRVWNGSSWGGELSGLTVNDTIRFAEAAAAPTRDEYVIGTEGAAGGVNVQVVNGTTDTAGNKVSMATVSDPTQRGFDIAYETLSGDAMVVSCSGSNGAFYRTWNGSSWSATSSISLLITTSCEWVKLASDPASDEIIAVIRDATTGTTDFETYVWDGSSWGNTQIVGSKNTATNEGIAVEYEESGNQAVIVYGNGTNNSFNYKTWDGSIWSATSTLAITNDFESGRLARDSGSDNMVLCYVDASLNLGIARWDGSTFLPSQNFVAAGANASTGHPVSCEFETSSGRDGFIMVPYSNTTQVAYTYWNGSIFSSLTQISTMGDSAEVRSVRTGDGNILTVSYNDGDTQYDFSYWNGTAWSTAQNLNTNSIATVAPPTIPVDIVARRYPTFLTGSIESTDINFSDGAGIRWGSIAISKTTPGSSSISIQLQYYNAASSTWALIPDSAFAGNSAGTTSTSIDISSLNTTTYANLRLIANLTCAGINCPTLNDWTLAWAPGVTISGTAKQFDETTNVTSGTVAVAVNGTLQVGKTAAISGGTWSIPNVRVFSGDVVTVFITGAADANEAVAVTKYAGVGNITNVGLNERHLTLGSDDNPTITNANIGIYDNSVSNNEDIFTDVTAGNTLNVCTTGLGGCFYSKLLIKSGTVYRPDSGSAGNVNVRHIQIDGTLVADSNTITVTGSWKNNYVFTKGGSTVIFAATSTAETVDSTSATSSAAFNIVTFGQNTSTSTWTLLSPLLASSTLSINNGVLVRGAQSILLSGDLTIGTNGIFAAGTATTTFLGSGSSTWTDSSSAKQYMGFVQIDGSAKTVTLASSVRATNITIGADDTLNAGGSNTIDVVGNWFNNNIFTAQTGTVNFIATTTGRTITPGGSSFYNLTFNGINGNWSFTTSMTTSTNNFTIATGTVTLPVGTTTVGGNWDTFGGAFQHNNSAVLFNATAAGKTIHVATSTPFYDMHFNGTGGTWSFIDTSATSSRSVVIAAGTVTLPTGTFTIGGSFAKQGGSFTAGNGTMKFTATNAQTIRLNNSSAGNMTFDGVSGSWTILDTHATSTGSMRFDNGTTTLPAGNMTVGGSLVVSNGAFLNNSGNIYLNAASTGFSVTPGNSIFYNLIFDSSTGGWTVTANATSSNNALLVRAANFAVTSGRVFAVGNQFTNSVGGTATTWSGSILSLYSATSTLINTKNNLGDQYDTLRVGTSTKVKMWNSSATTTTTDTAGYLYSQNNASSTGSLYIYGTYTNASDENWSYATDFDGTALSGAARRQVNVRIASSSVITLGSNNFNMVGTSTASTTVANQGSGFFSFNISGGTTTARYYTVASTTPAGLSISGTPVISSMDFGEFLLSTPSGGTSITVDAAAINANPTLQILYTRFATSTGVLNGSNVTESGSPTSYWWFKNGYGPFYGESYDNDPAPDGGNPGYIQFDDSGITANFSGHVYSDHGQTAMNVSVCDGATSVIVFRTSGGLSYSGTCDGSGAFSIPVTFNTSNVITAYLNTNGGPRAVTITKNVTGAVTGFDLYQNSTIIRQFDNTPTTISDMAFVDSSFDADIPFTATTSLMVQPNTELYVWTGKAFAPGGDVILQSGGSGDSRDGRLYIATSSTFTLSGTPNISIGGGLQIDSGATFTTSNSVINFTATTTGKGIFSFVPITFYDVVFNGTGGGWNLNATSTATSTMHSLTLTAGTLGGVSGVDVQTGGITGGGTIAMTGGIFRLQGTGNFGNSNPWQFRNLVFGNGSSNTITKTGAATTTVTGVLTVAASETLNAGSGPWVLFGGGTPLVLAGTFTVQSAPFWYTATSSTNITATTYAALFLAPTSSTPTYTFSSGIFTLGTTTIGDNATAVTVTALANDPTLDFTRDLQINASATLIASDLVDINIEGSWTNNGTFTPSNRRVVFDATTIGKTITPGSSSFYDLQFNSATGGWTILGNATSTHDTLLSSAVNFTLSSGKTLDVGGTFTNSVGGAATTWTGSILYLRSGTSYSANTRNDTGDTYGQLTIGASTNVRMWNSSGATTSVATNGSLYSQNHANVSGALNIWGAYTHSTGSDYWDYATDFDGTALVGPAQRKVTVSVASSSSLTFSGGLLDIIGDPSASTTIQVQGSGAYAFNVSGGTLNAQYYEIRNTDPNGLNLTGSPTITGLSNGDFLMATSSNTMITVAGSVITANPLKIIKFVKFATSTGVVNGFNVTGTGATASYWKFNLGYGNLYGESYDSDPTGDPGQVRFDDSQDHISISGKVYSDEGATISSACDGSSAVVRLKVAGLGSYAVSCASGSGLYSFPDVGFNPGDAIVIYLASSSARSAIVSRGPSGNVSNMDIYEHRMILRHEDATPISISDIDQYDSGQDSNLPFLATIAATSTLVVEPNTKVIVWTGKTFAPAGNVTVQSGGVGGAVDGSLELYTNSTFTAAGTQSHGIGGSFTINAGAVFTPANSTLTFTATTTGKIITPNTSTFNNVVFNGAGGNWAFSTVIATTTVNNFTITNGTVTLPSGVLSLGGSFTNQDTFMHNNGTAYFASVSTGNTIQASSSSFYNVIANGIGGAWSFVGSIATSSNNFTILNGTVTAPSGTLNVGGSFVNAGTFTANNGTVKMTSNLGGNSIQFGGATLYNLAFVGVGGGWTIADINATTSRDMVMATGTVRMPIGTMAVGGNFDTASTTFINSGGTVKFTATTTGFSINVGTSTFAGLMFDSATGGWTIGSNATSTGATTIARAASLTLSAGKSLEVEGVFTNSVGGAATTWTGSTLYLNSGTSYSINARGGTGDTYSQLTLGAGTIVSSWNSSADITTASAGASLYSQNHANVSGTLYIYGTYSKTSGTDYWSYATDFDGTDISGTPRQVSVRIATSSSVAYSGATLNVVGVSTASTTIYASGTSTYGFSLAGGALNASYYQFKNMDSNGIAISGTPIVTSLSNGDYELSAASGTIMTLEGTVVDNNANLTISNVRMASTTANIRGYNVAVTGAVGSFWTFTGAYGNVSGESYDLDGTSLCGHIRWDDSDCQFVNEAHYRWRNDDGGEGSPASLWYNASWSRRQRVTIANANATSYTNLPVKLSVTYDADMLANFDDLRFTDSSGTTSVAFWRESTSNSASTTIWVKVPSISANGSAVLYMYYGNAGAAAADDTSIFTYLEDFESNSIAAYSGDTGTSPTYFQTTGSFAHNGTYGLAGSATSGQTPTGIYKTGSQTSQGKTIRWFQYVDTTAGFNNDETCTLFGVQGALQNYAVCLEEFPSSQQRVSIARNVRSRDSSGTVMASTSVNYVTLGSRWLEVVVNWLTTNTINVSVYNPDGSVFATVSTTTSTYTSGGMGFAHFNQNGGWDTYMVKQYTATTPTYTFGSEQSSDGATWRFAEDTAATGILPNQNLRLRFSVQNTGTGVTNQYYRLQYAPKASFLNCESVPTVNYNDVPTQTGGCGSHAACMKTTTQFTDLASTSPLLSYPASLNFTPGYLVEDPSNESGYLSLPHNSATEFEYNFQITNSATQNAYCFRLWNAASSTDLANYDKVAEANVSYPPYITDFTLNLGNDISLTEGTTTIVYASSTVTDNNGYADIEFATSTIYRSGVANTHACTADENNCYQMSTSSCSLSNCSGNSCTLQCVSYVQYFADPTDASSTYSGENWFASMAVQDSIGLRDTQTAIGVDLLTLYGLNITTGNIDFGSLAVGQNTGTFDATTTVANTGNSPIDIKVSGTDLSSGANTIAVGQQKYATSTFAYGSCSLCQFLTGSAASVSVEIPKSTSTSTQNTSNLYWGIGIPSGTAAESFTGTNTFIAVQPGT